MNKNILNTGVQDFIENNWATDILTVALKKSPWPEISSQELAQQLKGKLRSKKKIPTWHHQRGIYYPKTVSLEQASSEEAALYKSTLISGSTLIDMTGGMGIDSYFFSRKFNAVTYCEKDRELAAIAEHNFRVLGVTNIDVFPEDGVEVLGNSEGFEWLYIDPSRRDTLQKRVFQLDDCEPAVVKLLPLFFKHAQNIMIKAAPMLDLTATLNQLKGIWQFHVVAVNNEVKEVLCLLKQGFQEEAEIVTVNIKKGKNERFSFFASEEKSITVPLGLIPGYLYEPNAAIMKAGAFKRIAQAFGLLKLQQHSHLYSSDALLEFPGKKYRIIEILPFQKTALKKAGFSKAQIATRNFPLSVEELRKRLKISAGGDTKLYFTTNHEHNKIVIVCKRI